MVTTAQHESLQLAKEKLGWTLEGGRRPASVSLNESVIHENVVLLAAYSGLLTRLGNGQREGGGGLTKVKADMTHTLPSYCSY